MLFPVPELTFTYFSKILAFCNVVSKFLLTLQTLHHFSEISKKSVQKNVQNLSVPRKSEFEYSKILSHVPSKQVFIEITRRVPLNLVYSPKGVPLSDRHLLYSWSTSLLKYSRESDCRKLMGKLFHNSAPL